MKFGSDVENKPPEITGAGFLTIFPLGPCMGVTNPLSKRNFRKSFNSGLLRTVGNCTEGSRTKVVRCNRVASDFRNAAATISQVLSRIISNTTKEPQSQF